MNSAYRMDGTTSKSCLILSSGRTNVKEQTYARSACQHYIFSSKDLKIEELMQNAQIFLIEQLDKMVEMLGSNLALSAEAQSRSKASSHIGVGKRYLVSS